MRSLELVPTDSETEATPMGVARTSLLNEIVEEIDEGFSVFDKNEKLIAWNRRFLDFLELPKHLREGTTLSEIFEIQARRGDFGEACGRDALRRRRVEFFEKVPLVRERITPSGRTIQIRRRAMANGAIISFYKDITEQKSAETKRNKAWAEAELASRSKTEFLAHMSHELRTPLNAIIGFSELMSAGILGKPSDEKYQEYVRDIHASGLLLLDIVNDVLDMSKIEAGKLELIFEKVVVQQAVQEAITIVAELAKQRDLKIILNAPGNEVNIIVDERAFKQIIINILSNAIKFSRQGGEIEVSIADDGDGIVLAVQDHGIGMTAEELKRALQPFVQAKPTTTRTYGGTGLGLPIVKGLIEAHRGILTIESVPGDGTTVRVMLRSDPVEAKAAATSPSPIIYRSLADDLSD